MMFFECRSCGEEVLTGKCCPSCGAEKPPQKSETKSNQRPRRWFNDPVTATLLAMTLLTVLGRTVTLISRVGWEAAGGAVLLIVGGGCLYAAIDYGDSLGEWSTRQGRKYAAFAAILLIGGMTALVRGLQ